MGIYLAGNFSTVRGLLTEDLVFCQEVVPDTMVFFLIRGGLKP